MQIAKNVFNIITTDLTSIKIIIKTFDEIIYANTFVSSQRYTYHDKIHQIVVQNKRAYKDLISCAIEAVEDFREKAEIKAKTKMKKIMNDETKNV